MSHTLILKTPGNKILGEIKRVTDGSFTPSPSPSPSEEGLYTYVYKGVIRKICRCTLRGVSGSANRLKLTLLISEENFQYNINKTGIPGVQIEVTQ